MSASVPARAAAPAPAVRSAALPGRTCILGLGNTILTDDGVGIYAARAVAEKLRAGAVPGASAEQVIEAETAGFALLEILTGWDRAIVIDAVEFDNVEPGTMVFVDAAELRTSLRLRSVHEIDLPTALEFGRALGWHMPQEVLVIGVQGADLLTLGERLTAKVAAVLPQVVQAVLTALRSADA